MSDTDGDFELGPGVEESVEQVLAEAPVHQDQVARPACDVASNNVAADAGYRRGEHGAVGGHDVGPVDAANLLEGPNCVGSGQTEGGPPMGPVDIVIEGNRIVAVGDEDGEIRLWELATGRTGGTRWRAGNGVTSLDYSSDGTRLASGDVVLRVVSVVEEEGSRKASKAR